MECFVDMKICDVYSNLCSTIKAWRKKIKPPSKVDLEVIFKGGFALFKQKEKMTNQLFENQKKKKKKERKGTVDLSWLFFFQLFSLYPLGDFHVS